MNCVQFNEEASVMLSGRLYEMDLIIIAYGNNHNLNLTVTQLLLNVLGSIDGTVRCWDTRSRRMEPIQILDEARDGVSSLKVSEHELLTGSEPN